MAMIDVNSIPFGDIIVRNIDMSIINQNIANRAVALASQMNPEAASQFEEDMKSYECTAKSEGNSISFDLDLSQSYLLKYLANHGTPVTGGDDGIAHNVDGSTYHSNVNPRNWGIELPMLELPVVDGKDEALKILELFSKDAMQNAIRKSTSDIYDYMNPILTEAILNTIGGDST